MINLFMASFGLLAMWIGLSRPDHPARRWGPVIGLCGQPFWFGFAYYAHSHGVDVWGLVVVCMAWTALYLVLIYRLWWKK